jgi:guanylate kinase
MMSDGLECEQGCESLKARVKELNFEPCFIFIVPPSLEELKRRLKGRYL